MNFLKHFILITRHKFVVFKMLIRIGLYKQAFLHDLSKYFPIEFWGSVRYFDGKRSPISLEKKAVGYSYGWINHKNKNKHHWEYWTDFKFGAPYAAKMPSKYLKEHIIDTIAASKVYNGKQFTKEMPLEFVTNELKYRHYHPQTKSALMFALDLYANTSEKRFNSYLKGSGLYELYNRSE